MGAGPLVPGNVDGADCPVVLLIVLGLDEAATAAVIDQITDREPLAGHVPVFFTDLDRFDLFRSKGHVFEHMPSVKSRSLAPEGLPWQHYTRRRLDLLQTKWRPAATIPFGPIASEALTGWRQVRDTTKFTGRFSNSHYTAGKMEAGT
ncbi:MAG: hypothetical protein ACR2Q4_01205 [Geminicoccaceae bacterium]